MILIRSSSNDTSTSNVIDWLRYFSSEYIIRVDDNSEINEVVYKINKDSPYPILILNDGQTIDFSKIRSVWYRRGHFSLKNPRLKIIEGITHKIAENVSSAVNGSNLIILKDLERRIKDIKHLNAFDDLGINKISILVLASEFGIHVPDTLITNNVDEILIFYEGKNKIITKTLATSSLNLTVSDETIQLQSYTSLVTRNDIIELAKGAINNVLNTASLFQEYIEKKFEIRSFFIEGDFYSMALFSQSNNMNKIDCRMESDSGFTRCVPFKLPLRIENSLRNLANHLSLNCGSFDILYSSNDEFVFLEVNPIGQYDWLSRSCNYFIDRLIAQKLLEQI